MDKLPYKLTLAGFVLTLIGTILFSTKAVIVKHAFMEVQADAVTLLAFRMLFSIPFYVAAAWFASRDEAALPMTRRQRVYTLILGLLGYYLSSLFDFLGLQYISAGLERLILFLYPTFAVLINAYYFRQRLGRAQVWALALSYAGILLAYLGELQMGAAGPGYFLGSFLVFVCAITYSMYIVGSGRMVPQVGATRFTAWAMLSATGGVLLHYLITNGAGALQQQGHLWTYGILLAILATVIPSFLISYGMKRIGSNNVAIISSLGPVSTILQAHYFLGEGFSVAQGIGTALVIVGVLLLGWRSQH